MNTIFLMRSTLFIILFFCIISDSIADELSLEARNTFMNLPKEYRERTKIYKIVLNKEMQNAFMQSMNMVQPKIDNLARQSRRKEDIQEAIDGGLTDMKLFLQDNPHLKLNRQDSSYFNYYKEYTKWNNTTFNIMYILTSIPNRKGEYALKGVLTGMISTLDASLFINKVFTLGNELSMLPARKSSGARNLYEDIQSLIDKGEVEDITYREIIPTRNHAFEREKASLILSILNGFSNVNVHTVPSTVTQDLQESIVGPMPVLNAKAKISRKKDEIIDGIESGEAQIDVFLRLNGFGAMNAYDRAFAKHHESYIIWKEDAFSDTYVITKKDNSTILGLILTECNDDQSTSLSCFEHAKKTLLPHELSGIRTKSEGQSLHTLLQNMLIKKQLKQVNP